ncbi:uncharacterized protein LOC136028416 [Artemia franciscana]|uniref:uncharacterized protein LOC136028416 n=1 Tax=Artemia franciscana TaxID=6661 RepID=UPI0032DB1ECA
MVLNMLKVFGIKNGEGQNVQRNSDQIPQLVRAEGDSAPVSSPRLSFLRARGRFAGNEEVQPSAPPLSQFSTATRVPCSPPLQRKLPPKRIGNPPVQTIQESSRKGVLQRPLTSSASRISSSQTSVSAPSSPRVIRGIKPPLQQSAIPGKGLPPRPPYIQPPANICVEKGRIEFVSKQEEQNENRECDTKIEVKAEKPNRVSKITPPKVDLAKLPAKFIDSGYGESSLSPPVSPGMPRFKMPERRSDKPPNSASTTPLLQRRTDYVRSISSSPNSELLKPSETVGNSDVPTYEEKVLCTNLSFNKVQKSVKETDIESKTPLKTLPKPRVENLTPKRVESDNSSGNLINKGLMTSSQIATQEIKINSPKKQCGPQPLKTSITKGVVKSDKPCTKKDMKLVDEAIKLEPVEGKGGANHGEAFTSKDAAKTDEEATTLDSHSVTQNRAPDTSDTVEVILSSLLCSCRGAAHFQKCCRLHQAFAW